MHRKSNAPACGHPPKIGQGFIGGWLTVFEPDISYKGGKNEGDGVPGEAQVITQIFRVIGFTDLSCCKEERKEVDQRRPPCQEVTLPGDPIGEGEAKDERVYYDCHYEIEEMFIEESHDQEFKFIRVCNRVVKNGLILRWVKASRISVPRSVRA